MPSLSFQCHAGMILHLAELADPALMRVLIAQSAVILDCCLKAHQNRKDMERVEADT